MCLISENNWNFNFTKPFFEELEYFLFKKEIYHLFKLKSLNDLVDQLVVINKQYPHSNCIENYSKFKCLYDCFKKNRLSKYFYNGNENGIIHLNYEYNQTVKQYEHDCLMKCEKDDCKVTYFIPTEKNDSSTSVFEATFFISRLDFYIQFAGLVCLIGNISFYQLLSILFEYIKPKIQKFKKIRISKKVIRITNHEKYLHLLKTIILLICVLCFLYYFISKIERVNNQVNNPIKTEAKSYQFELEPINLVICFPVVKVLQNYTSLTFLKIEKETDRFNDSVDEIYLMFMSKKIKIEWILTSKVMFKFCFLTTLCRCFQVKIIAIEPKYQSLYVTSKLIIKLKYNSSYLYFLLENNEFNSQSSRNQKRMNFLKKIIKRSKSKKREKCIDYEKEYSYCSSKHSCIDRCVNMKFIEDFKNITTRAIVYKDYFTKDQWSNSFPNSDKDNYTLIKKGCEIQYKNEDCYEIKLEYYNIKINSPKNHTVLQIHLYYEVINQLEEEPSIYKLLIDILSVQSIVFGQNVLKLLLIVYCLLNTKYQLRNRKCYLFVIYLICLSGFVYHTFFIFNQILREELIYYVYYTVENSIIIPNIIFCFSLENLKASPNYELTDSYLNKLTNNLTIDTIFQNITYLDKSNEWISLDANFTSFELNIETFYLLDKKCFKIKQNIKYDRSLFYLLNNTEVLKVHFNETLIRQVELITYFTKTNKKMQFGKLKELNFSKEYYKSSYTLSQEKIELTKDDKFNFIKSPFLLFRESDDSHNLMNNFEQDYNLRTRDLPSEKVNLNNEINDDLFKQFFDQETRKFQHNFHENLNIKRIFITTNIKKSDNSIALEPDFKFELNFIENKILITNENNFTKLILSLLNVMSLWLSLCILDLHAYVYYAYCKIVFFLNFIYRLLIRIKISLYRLI